jgi:hypothetical protein
VSGYKGICRSGYIIPNTGDFAFTYPQSEKSYASTNGYISLFDFESVNEELDEEHIILTSLTWIQFFFDQHPVTIVLELSRHELASRLIPNSCGPRVGSKEYSIYIPYVEAWYPEKIPVSAIRNYILTHTTKPDKADFKVYNSNQTTELEKEIRKFEK